MTANQARLVHAELVGEQGFI